MKKQTVQLDLGSIARDEAKVADFTADLEGQPMHDMSATWTEEYAASGTVKTSVVRQA